MPITPEQQRAVNPHHSIWVAASAGSGKTSVLTNRVLNLLLNDTAPEKILCLTFTKAAAAEMANRISDTLRNWAIADDAALSGALKMLTGQEPSEAFMQKARRLFVALLETPGGMKIMTIHSFCQSVLKRFPLEAGIAPHFEVIDENQANKLLAQALRKTLRDSAPADIALLSEYLSEEDLVALLQEMLAQRTALAALMEKYNGLDALVFHIKKHLNIEKYHTDSEIISDKFEGKDWEELKTRYLKKDETGVFKKYEGDAKAEQVFHVLEQLKSLKSVLLTQALLRLSYQMLAAYQAAKRTAAALDYDDLIETTQRLLERADMAQWVLFKLDGGLDHILVDEAQDTNPKQWAIIRMLAEEFFVGESARTACRTIFAVGDKKQSIFSFQGAEPREFERMRLFFTTKIKEAGQAFETVPLNLSFRSTKPILDLVNRVLKNPRARQGVLFDNEDEIHLSNRADEAGLVEIWPPEKAAESDKPESWSPPVERRHAQSALTRLAEKIALKIKQMIDSKEILESRGRPVTAGDFLILVQRRRGFVAELVRTLKELNIPVSGVDRLVLTDHIAIQDLLSAAKFALLPEDDLNLACLLKSPLFRVPEETLFALACKRPRTLWESVQEKEPARAEKLRQILALADTVPPFEFFSFLLGAFGGRKAFVARLGDEANDALDEFVNLVLAFEKTDVASLQGFVHRMMRQQAEIKRDMETAHNAVRIMTVHGSKGLQGNIVFLPDTHFVPVKKPKILWLEGELPLWIPEKNLRTAAVQEAYARVAQSMGEENKRLLYVALTRASDRLYICGYEGKRKAPADNWYELIANALSQQQPDKDGIIRLMAPQLKACKPQAAAVETSPEAALPAWALQAAPEEPAPTKPLRISHLTEAAAPELPLTPEQEKAMRRGTLLHQLLQYLPGLPQERWQQVIQTLRPPDTDVPESLLRLLQEPDFKMLFGADSLAEVPLVGLVDGQPVSGQIDRLVIRPDAVLIVDFKTNRHVPARAEEAPEMYRRQLNSYRLLIKQIFPDRVVRSYLLWTETMTLMEIK